MRLIDRLRADTFLKNNIVFFFGSLLVAFLNYLYYPIIGRIIDVSAFGEVQVMFSFVYLSSIVLTVFRMLVINITTNEDASTRNKKLNALFSLALLLHLPPVLVMFFASTFISSYMSFTSSYAFSVFALSILLSVYQTFTTAYMQGEKEFTRLSISQIIGAFLKLVFSCFIAFTAYQVFGATLALLLSSLFTLLYTLRYTKGLTFKIEKISHVFPVIQKELSYSLLILLSLGFVTTLYSFDVVVVKKLFSPEIAGLYSGIATIARTIYFITASVSGVVLSSVTLSDENGTNYHYLKKALYIVGLLGGAVTLLFSLFPEHITLLMLGSRYVPFAHYLPLVSLYLFFASVLNLLVSYLLALRAKQLLWASLGGLISLFVVLYTRHDTVLEVVEAFTISSFSMIVLLVGLTLHKNRRIHTQKHGKDSTHFNSHTTS